MDPFLVRLLIGALVWFIFSKVIELLVSNPKLKEILDVVLIIAVVCYVILGKFLPF